MTRIAVIGAGGMARVRTQALLVTGRVDVCGVAARHAESAERFGSEFGCDLCVDDYRRLSEARPEAVLVEVPHSVQDAAVLWALGQGLHVLIGGAPAGSSETMAEIIRLADSSGLTVETGYEARYTPLWQEAKGLIDRGDLGRPVAVRSIALWPGDPASWYYRQRESGGMPLVHMTYCFINPVRWLLGNPLGVSAFANRVKETGEEMIREETCIANLLLPGDVLYSATAGFVRPGTVPGWSVTIIGTRAAIELQPSEGTVQTMTVYDEAGGAQQHDFGPHGPAFQAQAEAFLDALSGSPGGRPCLNPPDDARWDTRAAEAIVESVRTAQTVRL